MPQFRPGAVAYHLHSFSARTLASAIFGGPAAADRRGATATRVAPKSLTSKPLRIPNFSFPIRHARLSFLAKPLNASQAGLSWQNTIIGIPLYRPFRKTSRRRYNELETSKGKNIEWSMLMWINFRLAQGAPARRDREILRSHTSAPKSAVLRRNSAQIYRLRGKLLRRA
jgi:hypothetical protein